MPKMRLTVLAAVAALAAGTAGPALACNSTEEVLARFEVIKNAYVAKAPSMTPEQFQLWTGHLEQFGDAMGRLDFSGACETLEVAAVDLGLDVPPAETAPTEVAGNGGGGLWGERHGVVSGDELYDQFAQSDSDDSDSSDTALADPGPPAEWTECPRGRCQFRDRGY